ncbi:MAG: PD-(D/E)XK nuclease-like domain-containing protein [Planctomycetota bacterium]
MRRMPYVDYAKIDAVNMSTLLELLLSPKHYRYRLHRPRKETEAMRVGRAGHTAVLEPMQFMREYVLQPEEFPDSKGTMKPASKKLKSCKGWHADQQAAGKTALSQDQYAKAERIQDAVRSHSVAGRILSDGQREISIEWADEQTGIRCKGRIDWLQDMALVDLKTTRHASSYAFAKQAANLNYHTRLAWYQHGICAVKNTREVWTMPVRIIAVQNEEPHDVVVYNVPEDALEVGRRRFHGLMETLKECMDTDSWPGVGEGEIIDLQMPGWALGAESGEGEKLTIGGQPLEV